MADEQSVVGALRAAVGDRWVLTGAAMAGYLTDWSGRFTGDALAVVRPSSTAEVAAVVRTCAEAGVPVVPQGGHTGLVGGGTPPVDGSAVVLSLTRMRTVRELDPAAGTVTVEAGVVLADLHERLAPHGRAFPVSLGSEGTATIGGLVSTNAGGTAVLRYGMTRDLVLGLEVVLPDGRVWDGLRALRKDNTGYDLTQLFVGAEGTLGVVTAAVLRLVPATPSRAVAIVALPSLDAAVRMLRLLQDRAGGELTAWEVMSRTALELVLTHVPGSRDPFAEAHEWYGLVEIAGAEGQGERVADVVESALGAAADERLLADAVLAGGAGQREALWALREGISEAQKVEGPSVKHDVTLPIGELAAFAAAAADRVHGVLPGTRLVTYGHVGDGNLHYNLSAPPGEEAALRDLASELTAAVYAEVVARGGSISAEHGLGRLKRAAAAAAKSEVEVELMRTLKAALDPRGLMNPGVLAP